MSKSGKILSIILAVLLIAAIVFGVTVNSSKTALQSQVTEAQTKVADLEAQLAQAKADAEAAVAAKEAELTAAKDEAAKAVADKEAELTQALSEKEAELAAAKDEAAKAVAAKEAELAAAKEAAEKTLSSDALPMEDKLVILHTNDIHGRVSANLDDGTMGYAGIAQYKKDYEALGAKVLLLDGGDATQGAPVVNLSYGSKAIEFMNAAGYDAMAVGNHEFDWGEDNALKLAGEANFPFLAANIMRKADGELYFKDRVIFDLGEGMKIGVFGLATPETLTKANPDKMQNVKILMGDEMFACAQAQVDALKAENCDLIVCMSHLGVSDESAGNRSTDMIPVVSGIDLVIDAHSHVVLNEMVGDTLLVSTGSYSENIGVIVWGDKGLNASLKPAVHEDPEVAAIVKATVDEVNEQLSAVFATTSVTLNGERDPGVRTEETNLGDFCCDAILWAAENATKAGVVAAINNGGGIRASIEAGDISMNNMKTVFPYGNTITVMTLKGSELLEALEAATCTTPDALGAFPQVAGIVMTIDTTVPYAQGEQYPDSTYFAPANPGARVKIESVGGQPFDVNADYVIATNNFSAAGGDTYYAFRYANSQTGYDTGVALEDALVNYVAEVLGGNVGEQYAQPQGRITVIK